jgi:hypothetical protein
VQEFRLQRLSFAFLALAMLVSRFQISTAKNLGNVDQHASPDRRCPFCHSCTPVLLPLISSSQFSS